MVGARRASQGLQGFVRAGLSLLAAWMGLLFLSCGGDDPFRVPLGDEVTIISSATIFDVTTPAEFPSAYEFSSGLPKSLAFEVSSSAGDIFVDVSGDTLLFKSLHLLTPDLSQTQRLRRTGMQRVTAVDFETLAEVPRTGYESDRGLPVVEGGVYAFLTDDLHFAKLVVDSIRPLPDSVGSSGLGVSITAAFQNQRENPTFKLRGEEEEAGEGE